MSKSIKLTYLDGQLFSVKLNIRAILSLARSCSCICPAASACAASCLRTSGIPWKTIFVRLLCFVLGIRSKYLFDKDTPDLLTIQNGTQMVAKIDPPLPTLRLMYTSSGLRTESTSLTWTRIPSVPMDALKEKSDAVHEKTFFSIYFLSFILTNLLITYSRDVVSWSIVKVNGSSFVILT